MRQRLLTRVSFCPRVQGAERGCLASSFPLCSGHEGQVEPTSITSVGHRPCSLWPCAPQRCWGGTKVPPLTTSHPQLNEHSTWRTTQESRGEPRLSEGKVFSLCCRLLTVVSFKVSVLMLQIEKDIKQRFRAPNQMLCQFIQWWIPTTQHFPAFSGAELKRKKKKDFLQLFILASLLAIYYLRC